MSFFPSGFHAAERRRTPWGKHPYTLEFHRGWEAVSALESAWRRLTQIHPDPAPCISWEAVNALQEVGLRRSTPLVVGLRMDGRLEAIFPFSARSWVGGIHMRFLGARLLHRHEPLVAPRVRALPAAPILKRIARKLGRGVLYDLAGLTPEGFGADWLRQSLSSTPGWYSAQGAREATISVAGGWEAVHVTVPQSLRRAAREARERARHQGDYRLAMVDGARKYLEQLLSLATRQGGFARSRPGRVLFALLRGAVEQGRILLATAHLGEELAAGSAVWIASGRAVELFATESAELVRFAPAKVLRVALLEHLAELEGVEQFRLPPGHAGQTSDLSPIPQYQERFWGAPFPGPARIAAQLGGWYSRHHLLRESPLDRALRILRPGQAGRAGRTEAIPGGAPAERATGATKEAAMAETSETIQV